MTAPQRPLFEEATTPTTSDAQGFHERVYGVGRADKEEDPGLRPPVQWAAIRAEAAEQEWDALRRWVDRLQDRFQALDHHAIPACWWKHNGHVEVLVALRDYERVSYSQLATPSAAVEWIRALRDMTLLLNEWTADLACGATHQPPISCTTVIDPDDWAQHVSEDTRLRASRESGSQPGF